MSLTHIYAHCSHLTSTTPGNTLTVAHMWYVCAFVCDCINHRKVRAVGVRAANIVWSGFDKTPTGTV